MTPQEDNIISKEAKPLLNNGGWIKLHRSILKWGWFDNPCTFLLFTYLILKANYEDNQWHGVTIKRGQCVLSRFTIARDTGLTPQSIRTSIARLKSTSEIVTKSTNRFTIVTICNYDKYQLVDCGNQPANQPTETQTNNQQTTSQQHYLKNIRSKEDKKNTTLPDILDTLRELAESKPKPKSKPSRPVSPYNTKRPYPREEANLPPDEDTLDRPVLLSDNQVDQAVLNPHMGRACLDFMVEEYRTSDRYDPQGLHFKTIMNWHRRNGSNGLVWADKGPQGPGYYKPWVIENYKQGKRQQELL